MPDRRGIYQEAVRRNVQTVRVERRVRSKKAGRTLSSVIGPAT